MVYVNMVNKNKIGTDLYLNLALNSQTTTTHPSPLPAHSVSTADNGCLTCPYINHGKTSDTFTNTGETRQIKHHITCDNI